VNHKTDCPKCRSENAWFAKTRTDLLVKCLCGYQKVVFTTLEAVEVEHNEPPSVRLPRIGTHLHSTLSCLASIEPASSKEVTDTLIFMGNTFTVSDVSSYLMMLRSRQLVEVVEYRRGLPGGSTWKLTPEARKLAGE